MPGKANPVWTRAEARILELHLSSHMEGRQLLNIHLLPPWVNVTRELGWGAGPEVGPWDCDSGCE